MIDKYIAYSLSAAHRAVQSAFADRARDLGIQIEAWRVLEALNSGETLSMGQLARTVLMNPPALSKLVDRMVADGLVHRQISRQDQRQVNLLITALGHKRMTQVRSAADAQDQELRALLGEEQVAQMQRILSTLGELKS